MQSDDVKAAVRRRLKSLMDTVYEEASINPEFLSKLERVLLPSDSRLENAIEAKQPSKKKALGLNLLEILHREGDVALQSAIETRTNDELAQICVQEGIRKLKDAKMLARPVLIDLLLETAKNRLRQGEAFVKRV